MFHFKQFSVLQNDSPLKVGTDACMLGAWAGGGKKILDIGTGTGIVALMMAQRFPEAEIMAIEIQPAAAKEAAFNFNRSPWSHNLQVVEHNLLTWQPDTLFDAMVCNPPYFSGGVLSGNRAKDIARHATELRIHDLLEWALSHLHPDGIFSLVFPANDSRLPAEAFNVGLHASRCLKVASQEGTPAVRSLWEFSPRVKDFSRNELAIEYASMPVHTSEYWRLMKDFYLEF